MLDHPRKTEELLTTLKVSVPFEIEIAPSVVEQLRDDGVAVADRTRFVVRNVSYAGDEGGIMCHVAHPQDGEAIVFIGGSEIARVSPWLSR